MRALTSAPFAPIIEGARRSDLANIRWLLDMESLPSADITEESLEDFLVYRDEIGVAGVVGLERYGEAALLRSLVVTSQYAGRGLGKRLVAAAEELAADLNVRAIYLLTTTAEGFFESNGFRYLKREYAPPAIQRARQFADLCPNTAVLMVKP
jgi:amino-acid N-acetyltransferase